MRSALSQFSQVLGFGLLSSTASLSAEAPNVLFICVDDLRPEINALGEDHMHTPAMDRLVHEGRAFTRHYVSVPICGASRHAMWTGGRPTTTRDTQNSAFSQLPSSFPPEPESMPDLFRRNGWQTTLIGKISHAENGFLWSTSGNLRTSASRPEMRFSWDEIVLEPGRWGAKTNPLFAYADGSQRDRGFSPAYEIGVDAQGMSLPDEAYPDALIASAAIGKLEEFAENDTPFFLSVGFYRPHLPFNAPKAYWDLYDRDRLPPPDPRSLPSGAIPATTNQSGEPVANYGEFWEDGTPADFNDPEYRKLLRHGYFASVSYVDAQIGKVLDALDALDLADRTIVVLWGDHGFCLDDYDRVGKHLLFERALLSPLIIRLPDQPFPGVPTDGIVEAIDIYPTLAQAVGLEAPASVDGTSLLPMVYNPYAPGKPWAYSRDQNTRSRDSIRTDSWRLIRSNSTYDLYDLASQPWEVADVSGAQSGVVTDLVQNALNVQSDRIDTTTYDAWLGLHFNSGEIADAVLTGRTDDPDRDGWNNFWEALGGSDPRSATDRPRYHPDSIGPGLQPVLTFEGVANFDDLAFSLEVSEDIGVWLEGRETYGNSTNLGNHLWRHEIPLPDLGDRGFLRLREIDLEAPFPPEGSE